jgi:hypothetical protein
MFLNSSPLQFTPRAIYGADRASLTDNDVNYYGFLESKEYQEVYETVLMQPVQSMDVYDSPYFGQGSGAYRELDKVYETYRQRFVDLNDTVFDKEEFLRGQQKTQEKFNEYLKSQEKQLNPGINPALILAAAAAFFFAG